MGCALPRQGPGVVVPRRAAAPGQAGGNFQVRGVSLANGRAPLVIIDGVPVSSQGQLRHLVE